MCAKKRLQGFDVDWRQFWKTVRQSDIALQVDESGLGGLERKCFRPADSLAEVVLVEIRRGTLGAELGPPLPVQGPRSMTGLGLPRRHAISDHLAAVLTSGLSLTWPSSLQARAFWLLPLARPAQDETRQFPRFPQRASLPRSTLPHPLCPHVLRFSRQGT